eukprot:PhM_4_TR5939/c1_g1_i1/m.65273
MFRKYFFRTAVTRTAHLSSIGVSSSSRCHYATQPPSTLGLRLAVTRPDLWKEWHPTKNTETPDTVDKNALLCDSPRVVWWKCHECSHEFQASVAERACVEDSCPNCLPMGSHYDRTAMQNSKDDANSSPIDPRESIAADETLMAEWHAVRNVGREPDTTAAASTSKVWWSCRRCAHEWAAAPKDRAECPACAVDGVLELRKQQLRDICTALNRPATVVSLGDDDKLDAEDLWEKRIGEQKVNTENVRRWAPRMSPSASTGTVEDKRFALADCDNQIAHLFETSTAQERASILAKMVPSAAQTQNPTSHLQQPTSQEVDQPPTTTANDYDNVLAKPAARPAAPVSAKPAAA